VFLCSRPTFAPTCKHFQDSLEKPVEETERDNKFSLNVARSKSVYGRVSVDWKAYGNIGDVTPISGQVSL